jgi:heme/copper-type cytochrome/quinol oxidase subunit 2
MSNTFKAPQTDNTRMWAKVRIVLGILVAAGKLNAMHQHNLNPVDPESINQDQLKSMQITDSFIVAICVVVIIWGCVTIWKLRHRKYA